MHYELLIFRKLIIEYECIYAQKYACFTINMGYMSMFEIRYLFSRFTFLYI